MVFVGCLRLIHIHYSIATLASWRPQHLVQFNNNNRANLRDLITVTGLVNLPKLDSNHWFFGPYDLEIWWITSSKIGHLFSATPSFVHQFKAIAEFKLELQSRNAQFWSKSAFFVPGDIEIWRMTLKNIRAPVLCYFKLCASFHSHRCYTPKIPNSGKNWQFFVPCDLEIWRMTLKNNRAPLLCHIKLCAPFHRHMWIQTAVTVRKRLNWVLNSVALTFDPWPWPFAWTSLLSMVITPENFMMIQWEGHCPKAVTDG